MSASSLLISLLSLTRHPRGATAARSLSAHRVRAAPRAADAYDRSVTTFSPEGRLLQLEYALVAAEARGRGLTVCAECDGVVVFACPSGDDGAEDAASSRPSSGAGSTSEARPPVGSGGEEGTTTGDDPSAAARVPATALAVPAEHDPTHNAKIHRLSPTHLLLTSGLAGDAQALAAAFRRLAASWTHVEYGEVVTARELAQEMGRVRHGLGLQPGARVLGVVGVLIGLDEADDGDETTADGDVGVEVRMYRSLPGGTVDRCNVCCSGGGADATGSAARKDAVATLSASLSPHEEAGEVERSPSGHDTASKNSSGEDPSSKREGRLRRAIEEVGRVALKYHPASRADGEPSRDAAGEGPAVDIWAVRAAPRGAAARGERGRAVASPHRYLGTARMDARYARRVGWDQVATAARCLVP